MYWKSSGLSRPCSFSRACWAATGIGLGLLAGLQGPPGMTSSITCINVNVISETARSTGIVHNIRRRTYWYIEPLLNTQPTGCFILSSRHKAGFADTVLAIQQLTRRLVPIGQVRQGPYSHK